MNQKVNPTALDVQVGGGHYKSLKIQPVEYIHANGLGFCEGSVVKYVTRWREKGGMKDLEKAKHFIDLLIELESKAAPLTDDIIKPQEGRSIFPPGFPANSFLK